MPNKKSVVFLDFETRSRCDLKKHGVYRYASHYSTEIMCLAWAVDSKPVQLWTEGQPFPADLQELIASGCELHAHNSGFESTIWSRHCVPMLGWPVVDFSQWRCTAAKAAYANHPRSLEQVSARLLPEGMGKDMEGHKIMQKLTRPSRKGEFIRPNNDEDKELFARMYEYCRTDVEVERAVDKVLPTWPEYEIKVWQLNEKINDRGVPFDRAFCEGAAKLLDNKLEVVGKRLADKTGGDITSGGQIQRIKKFVNERGLNVDSLDANTITAVLDSNEELDPDVEEILEFRQMTSGAAAKKYQAALDAMDPDDRGRGLFMYYGASMTGRFAGMRTQIHNMKKGSDKTGVFRDIISSGDAGLADLVYGNKLIRELGKNVRGLVCAVPEHVLLREDSSQIEARVLHWLAGNEKMLRLFREKLDPYIDLAEKIYNKKVNKEDPERQIGKFSVLGCGFGMGATRFAAQVREQAGVVLTAQFAQHIINVYRAENSLVVKFWRDVDNAMFAAVTRGVKVRVGKLLFGVVGEDPHKYLVLKLPSGRCLFYYRPEFEKTPKGNRFLYTSTRGVRYEWAGGLACENAVQAVARDTLVHYMLKAEERGLKIVAHVHDEIMCEAPEREAEEQARILTECFADKPDWADGLPCASEGKKGRRYS